MDSRHLETFHAVLHYGTLTATARELRCAQSTITIRIQELERELGLRLFHRVGRRLQLNEAGRVVASRTAGIASAVTALKEAARTYSTGQSGTVRMGAIEPTATHRLPALIASMCDRQRDLHFVLEVAGSDRVASFVAGGQIDFALTSPPPGELALTFEPWFAEPLALLVPVRCPLARKARITIQDLGRDDLLLTDRSCAYRVLIERRLQAFGLSISTSREIGSLSALQQLVASGLGMAIVPVCGSTPPPKGTLLRRVSGLDLALPLGLLTRPMNHEMTPAQLGVIAILRKRLARTDASASPK